MGQCDDFVILDAGHCFGGNHGVDDGLFSSLNGGGEDRTQLVVGQHFQVDDVVDSGGARICRGERDEDVAGTISGNTAVAAETQRNAAGEPLELMRDERRVRRNYDDDRAVVIVREGSAGVRNIIGNLPADGHARDAKIGRRP